MLKKIIFYTLLYINTTSLAQLPATNANMTGLVLDEIGLPVARAAVGVRDVVSGEKYVNNTDLNGYFTFTNLADSSYNVFVIPSGKNLYYEKLAVNLNSTNSLNNIVLVPVQLKPINVELEVTFANSTEKVIGATVRLFPSNDEILIQNPLAFSTKSFTDNNGVVAYKTIFPGKYYLNIKKKGVFPLVKFELNVSETDIQINWIPTNSVLPTFVIDVKMISR